MTAVIQYILYLVILVALAVPLGAYIKKVMNGRKHSCPGCSPPAKTWFTR